MYNLGFETIETGSIKTDDLRYKFTDDCRDIENLAGSVDKLGIVTPVTVRPGKDDTWIPLTGFNRIRSCRISDIDKIPAVIVQCDLSDPGADLACLQYAIASKAFTRQLTSCELIRSVSMLNRLQPVSAIARESVAVFNRALNEAIINDFLMINCLPEQVFPLLETSRLSLKTAARLTRLDPETAGLFLSVFQAVSLSSSNQLNMMDISREIAAREHIFLDTLFSCKEVVQVLENLQLDLKARGNSLLAYLKSRRYPALLKAQKDFVVHAGQLGLEPGMTLNHPQYFEGTDYTLSISFKSVNELGSRSKCLAAVIENPLLKKIIP